MERNVILTRLIEKFENSKHLTQPGSSNRRVMLRVNKKEIPEYQYETAAIRDEYNAAARRLENENIISLEWVPGRPVLSAIILNTQQVDTAYQNLKRSHPQRRAAEIYDIIHRELAMVTTPWICSWRQSTCRRVVQTLHLPSCCKQGDDYLIGLLRVMACYDDLHGGAITMRAFSTICFQDSKRFEREYRDGFLRIARLHHSELKAIIEDQEIGERDELAFLGIYARPELYELVGRCIVATRLGCADLWPLYPFGIAIPSTAIDLIESFDLSAIERIIFIENKTCYDEYLRNEISPEELVIYHGGFLSPQKRVLVKRIVTDLPPNISVYFWADIDLGGFRMFYHLRTLIPALIPMRMADEHVKQYACYGLARSHDYLHQLRLLLVNPEYSLFAQTIETILTNGVTIEQEAFLIGPSRRT